MFIYRNALRNLLRNRGRNILVSIILLIVMAAATVSLAVRAASETMIADFKDSFGVETHLITDWEYANANAKIVETIHDDGSVSMTSSVDTPEISLEQFMAFADSEYVKSTLFSAAGLYTSDDIEPIPLNDSLRRLEGMTLEELLETFSKETPEEIYEFVGGAEGLERIISLRRDIVGSIWGYSDVSIMRDFLEGQRVIADGRMIENPGEVIIGEKLAALNNLSVGDMFTITGAGVNDTAVIPLTIVGIFTDYQANLNSGNVWFGVEASDIIVSFDTLWSSGFSATFPIREDIRFFLTDVDAVEPFVNELREKGLSDYHTLYSDIEGYEKIIEPVSNMSSVATTFGIIAVLTGAVILVFLSVINIRERKYEVGVLRAIGMKRHQLARGMVYESLSLVLLCTMLGLTAGSVLANPVSRVLLNATETVGVSLNPALLPLLLLIALGLGVISSLIGVYYITKYEPMKILSEQN